MISTCLNFDRCNFHKDIRLRFSLIWKHNVGDVYNELHLVFACYGISGIPYPFIHSFNQSFIDGIQRVEEWPSKTLSTFRFDKLYFINIAIKLKKNHSIMFIWDFTVNNELSLFYITLLLDAWAVMSICSCVHAVVFWMFTIWINDIIYYISYNSLTLSLDAQSGVVLDWFFYS